MELAVVDDLCPACARVIRRPAVFYAIVLLTCVAECWFKSEIAVTSGWSRSKLTADQVMPTLAITPH